MKTPDSVCARRNDHLTFRGNVKQGRHGWLRLTPAYSLHVVEDVLNGCSPGDFALEPFSGTGTTPLASACLGIPCHAIDINPFLVWLGNTKVARYESDFPEQLRSSAADIVAALQRRQRHEEAWIPSLHQIEKWWDGPTLQALSDLFAAIGRVVPAAQQGLLKVAFCRVMIQSANVSFAHQSMSFKTREPTLFDKCSLADNVWSGFLDCVDTIGKSMAADQPRAEAKVFPGDSRKMSEALPRRDYSVVVTSPPYPNRMSYIRELRPYMYWLGYLDNGRQAGELDWKAIGGTWGCATSLLAKWEPAPNSDIPYEQFDQMIRRIRSKHDSLGRYVHRYFEDARTHISSLKTVLRSHARCHYIVGNSKFYDTIVPVERITRRSSRMPDSLT